MGNLPRKTKKMMFEDRQNEDPGTRQKRWLDHLWYRQPHGFRVCMEYKLNTGELRFSWIDVREAICPVDHREILKGEQVFEIDGPNREKNLKIMQAVSLYLDDWGVLHYIQDHNGKSPHLHLFNPPKQMADLKSNPILRRYPIDILKLQGSGLCREMGGRYQKREETYYASWFPTFDDIHPITDPREVRFPCLTNQG